MAKRFRPNEEELESELNLVPYMDIMLNLIMFILFSTTSLTQMGMIFINLPQYGAPQPVETTEKEEEPPAEVQVAIGTEGFTVMVNGVEANGNPGEVTIKRRNAGVWDYEALTKKLIEIKDKYPSQSTVVVVAAPDIEFDVLVACMDSCREDKPETGSRQLFPDVVLSVF